MAERGKMTKHFSNGCFSSLKFLYTNALSMGNKQEELESCMWSQGYDLIAVTETRWDSSYDWNAIMEGYALFKKDRTGRQGGRVALYKRPEENSKRTIEHSSLTGEQLECVDLCPGLNKE